MEPAPALLIFGVILFAAVLLWAQKRSNAPNKSESGAAVSGSLMHSADAPAPVKRVQGNAKAVNFQLCKSSPLDGYTFASSTPLGVGGYGSAFVVTKSRGPTSGQTFVLKRIPVKTLTEANEGLREAQHLQRLTHPNVVRVFDAFLHAATATKLEVCLVMEYCPRGDLYDAIKKRSPAVPITECKLTAWCAQLCGAVAAIHDADLIHRDIKPENILLCEDETLRLGDFGLAKYIPHTTEKLSGGEANYSVAGSLAYMAPEVVAEQPYGKSADIYSLGLVLLETCIGEILGDLDGYQQLSANVRAENAFLVAQVDKIPRLFATRNALASCITLMLSFDPVRRTDMRAIVDKFAGALWQHNILSTTSASGTEPQIAAFGRRSYSVPDERIARVRAAAARNAAATAAHTHGRQRGSTTGAITRAKSKLTHPVGEAAAPTPRGEDAAGSGEAVRQVALSSLDAKTKAKLLQIQRECMDKIDEEEESEHSSGGESPLQAPDARVSTIAGQARDHARKRRSAAVSDMPADKTARR
jgi:serine/threonine protein kinase